jgi:hypothetical protein
MNRKLFTLTALPAVTLMLCATAANAAPVYTGIYADMYLKQNTFPGGLAEEMVFLDAATNVSTVVGHAGSQTDSRLVTFSSTTDLLGAANGFSQISAADGLINNLTITAPGYWFEDLIFSVNLSPNNNMDLSITATDKSGGTDTFDNWVAAGLGNGENRILVLSTAGNLMQSVTIDSFLGMEALGGSDTFKRTEISGLTAVPVPAAVWLFGSGLLGLVGIARKRRS